MSELEWQHHSDPLFDAKAAGTLQKLQEQTGGELADGSVGAFQRFKEYSAELSAKAGEPVYITHDYCVIRVPGDAELGKRQLVRKEYPDGHEVIVSENHIRRFPRAWDAHLKGEDLRPTGTPLENCDAIPKERISALKANHVRTVEELSKLPDSALQRIGMDGRILQNMAKDWLEENNETTKLREEVAALRAEMSAQKVTEEAPANGDRKASATKRGGGNRSKSPG